MQQAVRLLENVDGILKGPLKFPRLLVKHDHHHLVLRPRRLLCFRASGRRELRYEGRGFYNQLNR